MSFQINNYYEEINNINDINDRDQYNECLIDNEQGPTPQGDELDNNFNINNSFFNNNNINSNYEHSNNNIDNLMDNEYSAAPIPLRRREVDISLNNNNVLIENNINNEKDLANSDDNNIFQNEIKNIVENFDNDKPLIHNDFSCFNPNFLDNDKDKTFFLILEENENINNINNINNNIIADEEKNNININIERITPYPGMNENNNPQNMNIMDAPVNNNLSNSSSSQNTNAASLSGISNSDNSLIMSSQFQIFSNNNNENNSNTFNPDKQKYNNKKENLMITKTKTKKNETLSDKNKKKKKYLRKFKPDSLRKKIKARLHKKLKEIINKNLKECGSKMFFDYFPQPFITNVNVMHNKAYLKLTMRTLFKMVFGNKTKDKEKVATNLKVLNYLDSNDKIRIKSGVDIFLNSTYEDIIQKYINGKLFDEDVRKLYMQGETKEYIDKYIFIGKHWVEFYKNDGKKLIME